MRYAFIQDNQRIWPIRRLYSTLDVHHSGYYAWLKQPTSKTKRKRQQLKVGGTLLYITCSILKAENEQQMVDFFVEHTDAKEIKIV